jgi:ABC-type branched-subunit amino acid transport system permease subunit
MGKMLRQNQIFLLFDWLILVMVLIASGYFSSHLSLPLFRFEELQRSYSLQLSQLVVFHLLLMNLNHYRLAGFLGRPLSDYLSKEPPRLAGFLERPLSD